MQSSRRQLYNTSKCIHLALQHSPQLRLPSALCAGAPNTAGVTRAASSAAQKAARNSTHCGNLLRGASESDCIATAASTLSCCGTHPRQLNSQVTAVSQSLLLVALLVACWFLFLCACVCAYLLQGLSCKVNLLPGHWRLLQAWHCMAARKATTVLFHSVACHV